MQFRQQLAKPPDSGWFLPVLALAALIYGSAARSDALPSAAPLAQPGELLVSPADVSGWQEQAFVGHTRYQAEEGGQGRALHATAMASASALCRNVQLDLRTLPIVRWNWRLDRPPPRTDERGRGGDDQGLRLSFLYRGGTTPSSILAIQYVWSQNEPQDAGWPNAFVPNAHEVVARSGPAQPGAWLAERRDLPEDFRAAFGRAVDRVDAICVMTDGDQTGALVEGWYGDITIQAR
ncbi:MAG: DUF3047 domain-containing protein [Dongiaceae bacterium]